MKKIIYLDIVSSIKKVRPAERKIFFNILPSRNYQVITLLNGSINENEKIHNNVIRIDCSSKKIIGFYKNIYDSVNSLLKENEINYIVVRNKVWLGVIVLFLKNYRNTKTIFIRAFPTELLSIHNAKKYFIIKKWLSILKNMVIQLIAHKVVKNFDVVFARSTFFARKLSKDLGKKVYSLPMGYDSSWKVDSTKKENLRKKLNPANRLMVGYFGAIDEGRDIHFIVKIFDRIIHSNQEKINGLIITEGDPNDIANLTKLINQYSLSKYLKIIGPYSYSDMPNVLSILDIAISPIPPVDVYLVSSPTKTIEAIGLGIPVIGNKEIEDQDKIINQSNCGFSVEYSIDGFYNGFNKLINQKNIDPIRNKGISYIKKNREYRVIADKFEKVVNRF